MSLMDLRAERPWELGKPATATEDLNCSKVQGRARVSLLRSAHAQPGEMSRTLRIEPGHGVNPIHSTGALADIDSVFRALANRTDTDGNPLLDAVELATAKVDVILTFAVVLAAMAGKIATFRDA